MPGASHASNRTTESAGAGPFRQIGLPREGAPSDGVPSILLQCLCEKLGRYRRGRRNHWIEPRAGIA